MSLNKFKSNIVSFSHACNHVAWETLSSFEFNYRTIHVYKQCKATDASARGVCTGKEKNALTSRCHTHENSPGNAMRHVKNTRFSLQNELPPSNSLPL